MSQKTTGDIHRQVNITRAENNNVDLIKVWLDNHDAFRRKRKNKNVVIAVRRETARCASREIDKALKCYETAVEK